MMFFQDTRSIGLIFWIVAALFVIDAAFVFLGAFYSEMVELPEYVTDAQGFCLVVGIGIAVTAVLYAMKAHHTMHKKNTRMELLQSYVRTVGLCSLLGDSFVGLAVYLFTNESLSGMWVTIATMILGVVLILVSSYIVNGRKGLLKKAIWVIIVVSFALMAIESLVPAENEWEFVDHVAHLVIAFFMLALLADRDIMTDMGVKS